MARMTRGRRFNCFCMRCPPFCSSGAIIFPPLLERSMKRLLIGVALVFSFVFAVSHAQQAPPAVAIDNDDIGGVVTGPNGPEAGVWVIAETRDLPVRYIKSVVTDDRGRYVVPDLPKANYTVWARGYGLV